MIGPADVRAAAQLLEGVADRTPVQYSRALTASTPAAQHVQTQVTGLTPGRHEFTSVLSNAAGSTRSDVVVVTVK